MIVLVVATHHLKSYGLEQIVLTPRANVIAYVGKTMFTAIYGKCYRRPPMLRPHNSPLALRSYSSNPKENEMRNKEIREIEREERKRTLAEIQHLPV